MDLASLFALAWPVLLKGSGYTLFFAVSAMLLGLPLAGLIALVRVLQVPVLTQLSAVYVSAMRGTPLLVQVFIVYYGLPSIGIEFSPVSAGILTLTLNVAAYMSETLRGGIHAVSRDQWLAGTSLGLTRQQTLRYVVAPQALRASVPSLSNSLISLIKDTSLVSVIAVTELMLATKELISTTFQPFPLYLMAALIYWVLSFVFEQLQRWMEKRMAYPH
ncbi:amino acid ABC transporter permease [Roseateles depolymerans]|uniref:Putative glutamine transport system permease protein GlnP n=1 Tax=Roseateles depolymerans TaxID=76731 RepID=A0A0U3L1R3_9BURK|nr:amino acid ABC transporter permease [Roseateles depolymerans]ALV05262.1 Amino acid ABC transporter permease [Roseateles depolymerans]REG14722.1 amino acid ABC transporter membrane protein (PAAT family) [Roseateles depolymerans]